jgi:uncharacterized YigZ family protein
MISYKTVAASATVEHTIEKSRFIGYISPVTSREEADDFIKEIKKKHKDATHNVPAFVIGEKGELMWASDDGEPQGTSGAPMLHILTGEGLTNVVVVVTRYFGGIKLGTGGLMRAYTETARMAIDAAGTCVMRELDVLSFSLDYTYYGKVQNKEQEGIFTITDTAFEDKVRLNLEVEPEQTAEVLEYLSELTGGACSDREIVIEKKLGKSRK